MSVTKRIRKNVAARGDSSDAVTPEALAKARLTFGLDVAPTFRAQQEQAEAKAKGFRDRLHAKRIRRTVDALGTPGDIARKGMQKQPPAEWVQALREISPESDAVSYLVFAWKEPLLEPARARWCLYEAIPDALITTERRMELAGAPYWERPLEERQAQAQVVSGYQWMMYHEHRVDVRPFWCLQGAEGGTPLHHSRQERRFLTLMGQPADPLHVGALPYAGWDNRVRAAVVDRDRLVRFGGSITQLRDSGTPDAFKSNVEAQEKAWRRQWWDHITARLAPSTELYAYILKHEDPDRHRQRAEDAIAAAEAKEVFIETGRMPDPSEYRNRALVFAAK
jgi:hypothetical protein